MGNVRNDASFLSMIENELSFSTWADGIALRADHYDIALVTLARIIAAKRSAQITTNVAHGS